MDTHASEALGRTPQAEPAIKVRGLVKRFGHRTILDGLDLTVASGETYALLGPNGAGKSTTIEMLEGFRRADSGEIRVLGEHPERAPRAWRGRIGIVGQQTGDLGVFTPRELVAHFRASYANPRGVDEVLELVGLAAHANRRASKLSGGQQRRLDVALGIVGRPELLFLDEPTTGFDPDARRQFWSMIELLQAEGTSILLTTHYLDEAARLANRVGVILGGPLIAEAAPAELGGAEARTPLVTWTEGGEARQQRTHTPGEFVAALTARLGEPAQLEVQRPSLEDIYLELIGEAEAAK